MSLAMRALDAQLDLLRSLQSDIGARYIYGWAHDRLAKFEIPGMTVDDYATVLYEGQLGVVEQAATYGVADDIIESIEQAAALLPDDATLQPTDIPTELGFIFLEHPIYMEDDAGLPTSIGAIGWAKVVDVNNDGMLQIGTAGPDDVVKGVLVFAYSDSFGPDDPLLQTLRDSGASEDQIAQVPRYTLWHWQPVEYDTQVAGTDPLLRFLFTLWCFMGETWIDNRMIMPDRPAMKRARRLKVSPEVRVVRLRKKEVRTTDRGTDDDAEVIWSHRWIVEGHWRNQWYPSLQTHRPKWIPRHIKGPEDRPLILKDRVFSVDR